MVSVTDNTKLTEIFSAVAKDNGFGETTAHFTPFADFKITWEMSRSTKDVSFMVSDYAMKMDEKNIRTLAEIMCRRLKGEQIEGEYKDEFNKYVLSREFYTENQPFYIERKSLEKVPFRMIGDVSVHWSKKPLYNPGQASTLMKIITLDYNLKNAPDYVINAVINKEYNIIQDGVLSFGGDAKYINIDKGEAIKAKTWLVNNDYKLNGGLFD